MSLSKESIGNTTDDLWQQYEPIIRRLYQTKSFKQMKYTMETQYGFPKLADKTWHEKLGNRRIRKTLTDELWCKIYRHCDYYRLEDPSRMMGSKRLKRTKRRTEVIFGDRTYEWDQAWRNMKRARKRVVKQSGTIVRSQIGPPSPLPPDVTVRTPPAVRSPSPRIFSSTLQPLDNFSTTIQAQGTISSFACGLVRKGNNHSGGGEMSIQQSQPLVPSLNHSLPLDYCSPADYLKAQMLVHLPGLPIWNLSNTLVEMADLDLSSQNSPCKPWSVTAAALSPHITGIEMMNDSVFHNLDVFACLTITQPSSAIATFNTRHRVYLTISMAIYLLSNNLVHPEWVSESPVHKSFFETLDSVFTEMPARHLRALLQKRLASVRAAFEALLVISGYLKQHFAFKSLVELGASSNWLAVSAKGHQYLCHAACMDLDEVVQKLLRIGCRPEKLASYAGRRTTAIVEALKWCHTQCAELLLEYCDVNGQFEFGDSDRYRIFTSFTFFVEEVHDLNETMFFQGMELFLNAGADTNSLLHVDIYAASRGIMWSVQDYIFCFHPSLFDKLIPNSNLSEVSNPTRAGILTSLKLGPNTLAEFCDRLAQNFGRERLYEYLELLVVEQLTGFGPWRKGPRNIVDLETVRALVDVGVSKDEGLSRAESLVSYYMESIGEEDYDLEVIRYLLDSGAKVDDKTARDAVLSENTNFLALLVQKAMDIQHQGPSAVVVAATQNNFEAVRILIDAGVDINAEFRITPGLFELWEAAQQPQTASVLCHIINLWYKSFDDLKNMIDFLLKRGAHLRLSARKPHPSDLVENVLEYCGPGLCEGVLEGVVRYIMDARRDFSDSVVSSATLLEACGYRGAPLPRPEEIEILEFRVRNGAPLHTGAPLAAWIGLGGGAELVEEMLCRGADINAYHHSTCCVRTALQAAAVRYSEELVKLLLQKGAEVNASAKGDNGKTALQAICYDIPGPSAEKAQQMSIIDILLAYGADVNAPARCMSWRTALQAICQYIPESPAEQAQQLKIIKILLGHGADANALAGCGSEWTALQAVCTTYPQSPEERAQQTVIISLLLANGADVNAAPSRRRGRTALQLAAERGNLEVAIFLLSSDPPADVNMPPCQYPDHSGILGNALDSAAYMGRIDTVKLLLNNHALSGYPGDTGYDGAIRAADERGHLAVAELIREHVATVFGSNSWYANLSQPQRDWREYRYDDYSDGHTIWSENGDDDEDESIAQFEGVKSSESGDDGFSEFGDEEGPLAQVHIRSKVIESTGFEHTVAEPGFVWDVEVDEMAQVQIQSGAVQHSGFEHTAPEPDSVWDMEIDEPLDLDIPSSNISDSMGCTYGLDYAPST